MTLKYYTTLTLPLDILFLTVVENEKEGVEEAITLFCESNKFKITRKDCFHIIAPEQCRIRSFNIIRYILSNSKNDIFHVGTYCFRDYGSPSVSEFLPYLFERVPSSYFAMVGITAGSPRKVGDISIGSLLVPNKFIDSRLSKTSPNGKSSPAQPLTVEHPISYEVDGDICKIFSREFFNPKEVNWILARVFQFCSLVALAKNDSASGSANKNSTIAELKTKAIEFNQRFKSHPIVPIPNTPPSETLSFENGNETNPPPLPDTLENVQPDVRYAVDHYIKTTQSHNGEKKAKVILQDSLKLLGIPWSSLDNTVTTNCKFLPNKAVSHGSIVTTDSVRRDLDDSKVQEFFKTNNAVGAEMEGAHFCRLLADYNKTGIFCKAVTDFGTICKDKSHQVFGSVRAAYFVLLFLVQVKKVSKAKLLSPPTIVKSSSSLEKLTSSSSSSIKRFKPSSFYKPHISSFKALEDAVSNEEIDACEVIDPTGANLMKVQNFPGLEDLARSQSELKYLLNNPPCSREEIQSDLERQINAGQEALDDLKSQLENIDSTLEQKTTDFQQKTSQTRSKISTLKGALLPSALKFLDKKAAIAIEAEAEPEPLADGEMDMTQPIEEEDENVNSSKFCSEFFDRGNKNSYKYPLSRFSFVKNSKFFDSFEKSQIPMSRDSLARLLENIKFTSPPNSNPVWVTLRRKRSRS